MHMLKEKPFLTPNDNGFAGTDDAVSIQNAIDAAADAGVNKVIIPRYNQRSDSNIWTICATIRIPSGMTLILDNCHLQLAPDFQGPMITNSLAYTEEGKLIAGTQTNIQILGKGMAVIDGGLHENPAGQNEPLLYFHNVREFCVEGFRIVEPRGCGLCFLYCSYGKVACIDFDAKGDIPNRDGIVLRRGCYNITVEDITGYTADRVIALVALAGEQVDVPYSVMGHSIDVRNIIIKNIKATSCGRSSIIELFNQDGSVLYNILIENVSDISVPYCEKRPFCAVRIGGTGAEAKVREALHGETKNITIRNVFTHARYGVAISNTLFNSLIENLHIHDDGEYAVGVCPAGENGVTSLSNLLFKGIYYNVDQRSGDGNIQLTPAEYVGGVFTFDNCEGKNIRIIDVFAGKIAQLAAVTVEIAIDMADVTIDELSDTLMKVDEKAQVTCKNVKVKGEIQK